MKLNVSFDLKVVGVTNLDFLRLSDAIYMIEMSQVIIQWKTETLFSDYLPIFNKKFILRNVPQIWSQNH